MKRKVDMCQEPGCVLWSGHPPGEHRERRGSLLACPHNIPNFGPPCPVCDYDDDATEGQE